MLKLTVASAARPSARRWCPSLLLPRKRRHVVAYRRRIDVSVTIIAGVVYNAAGMHIQDVLTLTHFRLYYSWA